MNNVRKLWENCNITNIFPKLASSVCFDEPMNRHTSFRVGGPADLFVEPYDRDSLIALIELFSANRVPISILGGGSNILVSDSGIRGTVISLSSFKGIEYCGRIDQGSAPSDAPVLIRSGAGASMKEITEWCAEENLAGLERFAGLPGSVGGALYMNARCYEISVSDRFFGAEVLHFIGGRCTIEERNFDSGEWSYKKSPFQKPASFDQMVLDENTLIVLSAVFALSAGDRQLIRSEMDSFIRDREEKGHFRFPSAGSMFKNNHAFGKPSGKIIDEAGLRGFRIGDAQVAPWHGNIVINAGNATALDLRTLVEEVRKQVFEKTGFLLESEVIMTGDWDQFF